MDNSIFTYYKFDTTHSFSWNPTVTWNTGLINAWIVLQFLAVHNSCGQGV